MIVLIQVVGTRLHGGANRCSRGGEAEEIWLVLKEKTGDYSSETCFSTAFCCDICKYQETDQGGSGWNV